MISNIDVYWAIAEEAHIAMRAALDQNVTPNADGQPGYTIRWDPERRSFKSAMITVVFCGMVLDALLYTSLCGRRGRVEALRFDRRPYERRLEALGITDAGILDRVKAFREARKDLVHEKAIELADVGNHPMHTGQAAADSAVALLRDIRKLLTPG